MRHPIAILLLLLTFTLPAAAHSFKLDAIDIGHAWARATAANATVASAYMPFLNTGTESDTLTSAETPLANMVMLHETTEENGIASMRMLENIALVPGKPVALRPGGKHFMLMGLKRQLKEGDTFPMTLHFAKSGNIEIQIMVHAPGDKSPPH